jgi:hypothetical protein
MPSRPAIDQPRCITPRPENCSYPTNNLTPTNIHPGLVADGRKYFFTCDNEFFP